MATKNKEHLNVRVSKLTSNNLKLLYKVNVKHGFRGSYAIFVEDMLVKGIEPHLPYLNQLVKTMERVKEV